MIQISKPSKTSACKEALWRLWYFFYFMMAVTFCLGGLCIVLQNNLIQGQILLLEEEFWRILLLLKNRRRYKVNCFQASTNISAKECNWSMAAPRTGLWVQFYRTLILLTLDSWFLLLLTFAGFAIRLQSESHRAAAADPCSCVLTGAVAATIVYSAALYKGLKREMEEHKWPVHTLCWFPYPTKASCSYWNWTWHGWWLGLHNIRYCDDDNTGKYWQYQVRHVPHFLIYLTVSICGYVICPVWAFAESPGQMLY